MFKKNLNDNNLLVIAQKNGSILTNIFLTRQSLKIYFLPTCQIIVEIVGNRDSYLAVMFK